VPEQQAEVGTLELEPEPQSEEVPDPPGNETIGQEVMVTPQNPAESRLQTAPAVEPSAHSIVATERLMSRLQVQSPVVTGVGARSVQSVEDHAQ